MIQKTKKHNMPVSLILATVLALAIIMPTGISDDNKIDDGISSTDDNCDDSEMGAYSRVHPEPAEGILDTPIQYEIQKLLASDGAEWDQFGDSVAIDGDAAVIGAPSYEKNGIKTGAAYIFRYTGSEWVEEQLLLASDGEEGDQFGNSVAIEDDVVVVGAWLDDDNGESSGSVYVFRFDGSTWVEEAKLLPSDGAKDYWFGLSVAISDDTIIVGAPAPDDYGTLQGRAYIFRYNGSSWIEEQKITASDGGSYDLFGFSVAIDGYVAVIEGNTNAVYVNRYDGTIWVEEQKITFPIYVTSVAINGDVCIVGLGADDENGYDAGSAYIYRYDGSTWVEEQKLLASDGEESDYFGGSVAIDGDWLIVGADQMIHDDNAPGKAYFYRYNGLTWVEEAKLLASDSIPDQLFGCSVALDNHRALIGAEWDSEIDFRAGAAYIFNLLPGDINGDGDVDTSDLLLLLGYWGSSGGPADINHDGIVDTEDLLILLGNWTG